MISKQEIGKRLAEIDWCKIESDLNQVGFARTASILSVEECRVLIEQYDEPGVFRSRVVMERHQFGFGEYQYFADPLPEVVSRLREDLYPPLSRISQRWAAELESGEQFPNDLEGLLALCSKHGQTRPTPLMLRYGAGGYNCLHQDLYGEIAFPLQAVCVLSEPGCDYTGGEFLLVEQRPRMQSRGEAISLQRGELLFFPNRYRPVKGTRGSYRVQVRHGLSRLHSGRRFSLGIIFHNAK
jgi:hypothetical protein